VLTAAGLTVPVVAAGRPQVSFVLTEEHDSVKWRHTAHKPAPPLEERGALWTRHDVVGIGNALGSFSNAVRFALAEDRALVLRSRILQKFCEMVLCNMRPLPGDNVASKNMVALAEKSGDWQKLLNNQNERDKPNFERVVTARDRTPSPLDVYYNASGCAQPPAGYPREDAHKWPNLCLYSKNVRSLVVGGPSGRLARERSWLEQFYVGSKARFDAVMRVDPSQPPPFDISVHLRTLALIESYASEDGLAIDPKGQADAFLASANFALMVKCLAAQIADGVKRGPPRPTRALSIYLATDSADIHDRFALRLQAAAAEALNALVPAAEWAVEVDYFKGALPPAHWQVWTFTMPEMKKEAWQQLAGTTAEWLFMAGGDRMLTVRGIKGGEHNSPSSFAASAAAFGLAREMLYLQRSSLEESKLLCHWIPVARFRGSA
jgi:hypothetical protein